MSEIVETPRAFGPNAWLIEEMFRQYREDPASLSESWRDFFADYRPLGAPAETAATPAPPVPVPRLEEKDNGHAAAVPPGAVALKGGFVRIVENMERSLSIPTATSVRTLPVKILEENRRIINQYLTDTTGAKMSF